jgi:NADH-quinone oxidoreductase subunit E
MSGSVGIAENGPEQPKSFAFTAENLDTANKIVAKYPSGRQQSAVMPLLDLAQRQSGGWLPRAAMDYVADLLTMPRIKAYEVATFYSMYNLKPVGKHFVQVCTTTPCWLVGSEGIVDACKKHLGIGPGETTADGQFTLIEVECLGACVNAPMAQINDDYYEDLTPENTVALLQALADGKPVKTGSQTGRRGSQAKSGPTSLHERAKAAGVEG